MAAYLDAGEDTDGSETPDPVSTLERLASLYEGGVFTDSASAAAERDPLRPAPGGLPAHAY